MINEDVDQLLKEIEHILYTKNLSKREIAKKINIPYSTLKKWFQKGEVIRNPSKSNIKKLKKFIESQKQVEEYWQKLWIKFLKWWETQHCYSTVRELADEIGWDSQNLTTHFQNKERPPKLVIEKIARTIGFEIPTLDFWIKEAQRKTERMKYLLLLLENELRWFRDGSEEVRDIFRKSLDLGDIGYISSLLTMLGDEEKFKRWLTLTTYRFNFFKIRGEGNEKSTD